MAELLQAALDLVLRYVLLDTGVQVLRKRYVKLENIRLRVQHSVQTVREEHFLLLLARHRVHHALWDTILLLQPLHHVQCAP